MEIRLDFEGCKQKRKTAEAGIEEVVCELEPVVAQLRAIEQVGQRFTDLQTQLAIAESQRIDLAKQNSLLQKGLNPEYRETDKELRQRATNFQAHLSSKADQVKTLEMERTVAAQEIARVQGHVADLRTQQGALSNAVEENDKRIQHRNSLIKKLARGNHIDGYDASPFSDQQVGHFIAALLSKRSKAQQDVDAAQAAFKAHDMATREELDALSSRSTQLRETMRHTKESLMDAGTQLKRTQTELAGLKVPEVDVATASRDKAEAEQHVAKLRTEAKHSKLGDEQALLERERNTLRFELTQKKHEQEAMTSQLKVRTSLEMKRRTRQTKEDERNHLLRTRDRDLKDLFGHAPQTGDVLRLHKDILRAREARYEEVSMRMQDLQRQLSVNQSQQKRLREELSSRTKLLTTNQHELAAVLGTADFDEVLADRKAAVTKAQELVGKATNIAHVYKNFRKTATSSNSCPLCTRAWGTPAEMADFLQELDEKIAGSIPAAMEQRKEALAKATEELGRVEKLRAVSSAVQVMEQNTLPALRSELSAVSEQGDRLQAEVNDDAEIAMAEAISELNAAKDLRGDCERLYRLFVETATLADDIAKEERLLPEASSNRTLEAVNEEINALNRRIDEASNGIDRVRTKLSNQERDLTRAELRVTDMEKRVLEILRESEAIDRCRASQQQLQDSINKLTHELSAMKKQMDPLQSRLDDVSSRRQHAEADYQVSRRQLQAVLEGLDTERATLDSLQSAVVAFAAKGTEQRLEDCQANITGQAVKLEELVAA